MIKAGITGAKGFIGLHIKQALEEKDNFSVEGCDRNDYNLLTEIPQSFVDNKDVIIHTVGINRGTDLEVISGSIVVTYNLLTAIKKSEANPKIIFLSSVHADDKNSVYGQSKKLTEVMLKSFSESENIPVTVLRLANVFGEGCKPFYNSVIATFCYQTAHNEDLKIRGGDNKVKFLYIKDVVKKIINHAEKKDGSQFIIETVSSDDEISIKNLAETIKSFKEIKDESELDSDFKKKLYKTYLSYAKTSK
jgi:UDP-2-acetamido-2,6-beta-L-arabino-hexul-4-ose reductase